MPIQRSGPYEDGHDDFIHTETIDSPYPTTPTRASRRSAAQSAPNTDEVRLASEGMTSDQPDYDTQDIILLEPKASPRQSSKRSSGTSQPIRQTSAARQSTSSRDAVRQPSSSRPAVRQTTDARDAVRQPTSSRSAVRQTTSSRSAVRQTTDGLRSAQQPARKTDSVRQTTQPRGSEKLSPQAQPQGRRYHWLVPTGIFMIIAIACYLLAYGAWIGGQSVYNNLTYGSGTRTSQFDAVVGDHDSAASPTHFIALNLHGTIDIIEFPGGDVTHAKVFPGPHLLWSNADRAVVTLTAKDVNGDQKPDIVVHVQGGTDLLFHQTTANFVLLNNGSGFSPMNGLSS